MNEFKVKVLVLYNATQTYTNAAFEHLDCFAKYSANRYFYSHCDEKSQLHIELNDFDVVIVHYSIRLVFDQIARRISDNLNGYAGLKVLFIQDEYDHTCCAWHWITQIGFNLVFTVVPSGNIPRIYPPEEFVGIRFISNLTGYVPSDAKTHSLVPPSRRRVIVGYRGRPLPIRYGQLGREKIAIGSLVRQYCEANAIPHDIAWSEEDRIYGPKWYDFMTRCRAMLGTESGSNVFDWEGDLSAQIRSYKENNPGATEDDVYRAVIQPRELPGLMGQISPRIFEAIALRTALVLFEGSYSGVITPNIHFIPLKKDGSNLKEVFELLNDGAFVDAMADRAYEDVIVSEKYSYASFVEMVDQQLMLTIKELAASREVVASDVTLIDKAHREMITTHPIRAQSPGVNLLRQYFGMRMVKISFALWERVPEVIRGVARPHLRRFLLKE